MMRLRPSFLRALRVSTARSSSALLRPVAGHRLMCDSIHEHKMVSSVPLDLVTESGAVKNVSEVDDPQVIFDTAWRNIEQARGGIENMVFPKEIIWLAGAPGAGKGTVSKFVMDERHITAPPIETSSLLVGERFQKMKDEGRLIGDREVVQAVLESLLDDANQMGVIVDGFPRTKPQAECISLLHERMQQVRQKFREHPVLRQRFRRPVFHIAVLYVEEEESVQRQLARGKQALRDNRRSMEVGMDAVSKTRVTDVSRELAQERYRVFKEQVYEALKCIKDKFHFHLIPADGSIQEVKELIRKEFQYQSSLELADGTYEMVRTVLPASSVVQNARQKMIQRLNSYSEEHQELFQQVLDLLNQDFLHILQRQALSGKAIIRSNSPVLSNSIAVNMVLDVLAERGYIVVLDVVKERLPTGVELPVPGTSVPQRIAHKVLKSYVFYIEFERPRIRRGD